MPELHVTLIKATDLAAADSGFHGRSSDPYVTLQVGDECVRSSTFKNQLNPVWRPAERFEFEIYDIDAENLHIQVVDHDTMNSDDLIGSLSLPVARFMKHANNPVVETFPLIIPDELEHQHTDSTIELEVCLKVEDDGQKTLHIWENELWQGGSWVPANNHERRHWSTFDQKVSSNTFEDVAPEVPDGLEGQGWAYSTRKGDEHGWMYASSFTGPWSSSKGSSAYARRRLWQNNCRPAIACE